MWYQGQQEDSLPVSRVGLSPAGSPLSASNGMLTGKVDELANDMFPYDDL
jgi:hypothetical protein